MAIRAGTTLATGGGIRPSSNEFEVLGLTFTVTPTVVARTSSSFTVSGSMATEGDVFAVAVLQTDTAPTTPAQIIAGNNGDDLPAQGTGSQSAVTSFSFNITGTGLTGSLPFDIYIVGRIPEGT